MRRFKGILLLILMFGFATTITGCAELILNLVGSTLGATGRPGAGAIVQQSGNIVSIGRQMAAQRRGMAYAPDLVEGRPDGVGGLGTGGRRDTLGEGWGDYARRRDVLAMRGIGQARQGMGDSIAAAEVF